VILDADQRVGHAWRRRWDSLRLFTPARYSGLPGWPFPAPPSCARAGCWWWGPTWLSGPDTGHIPVGTGSRWDRGSSP
jgi:cation diffusion facilitator CzcD-associated flavoprotein CzcO